MELEGSLLCLQDSTNGSYPEPHEALLPKIHFNIILSSAPRSLKWSLPFRFFNQNDVLVSHLSQVCTMPCLSHTLWFDQSNNILWQLPVMKLLTMQSAL